MRCLAKGMPTVPPGIAEEGRRNRHVKRKTDLQTGVDIARCQQCSEGEARQNRPQRQLALTIRHRPTLKNISPQGKGL